MTCIVNRSAAWLFLAAAAGLGCFDVTLTPQTESADPAKPSDDADASPPKDPDAGPADGGQPAHPACAPGAVRMAPPFSPTVSPDLERLNQFHSLPCTGESALASCDAATPCLLGKCLLLQPDSPGVCVDDDVCETPLVFQDGRCNSCISSQAKADICCNSPPGVACGTFPAAAPSGVGGSCAADEQCEAGLVCTAGRGRSLLGTCSCPEAVLPSLSSAVGCGSADSPNDLRPPIPVFTPDNRANIVLVGDELAREVENTIRWWLDANKNVRMFSSTLTRGALCDFVTGSEGTLADTARLRASVRDARAHLVIMQFWGFASAPCLNGVEYASAAYYERMLSSALAALEDIEAGAREANIARPRVLWVLQGPDADLPDRVRQLNAIYAAVAAETGDRISDAGRTVSQAAEPNSSEQDRYVWMSELTCNTFERAYGYCTRPEDRAGLGTAVIHEPDEKVLFCLRDASVPPRCQTKSPGVARYGLRIVDDVTAWLRLR